MSDFIYYLVAFALVLGVLIIVHEYGHYVVARLTGVRVLRFSVGFGRTLWSRKIGRDGTEWAIGLFPLGGYVKMLDEREGVVAPEELHRSFNRKSVWRRMAIVAAGPAANLFLAVVIYWGLYWHGVEELRPILGVPAISSPAATSGIENGERVVRVDGELVQTWQDMRWRLLNRAIKHDSVELEVINQRSEVAFRRLDLSAAKENGWEGDALEKLGIDFYRPLLPPIIGSVNQGAAAAEAGLRAGDVVLSIGERKVTRWSDVVFTVRESPGLSLSFEIDRRGERLSIAVVPAAVTDKGRVIGRIGAAVAEGGVSRDDLMITIRYGVAEAFGKSIKETWDKSVFSLVMIGKMITGEVSWRNISGPVTIADYAGQSAKLGVDYYLKFMALVSISLAVLNLLPVPILDGGHLLYYVIEVIRRGPLSERSMEIGQRVGLALLIMLMVFAFYNDINRLISG
jgi:regulator of sigma E protease